MNMTKDDLIFLIDTKKTLEFSYNGKNYNLTYDKDEKGEYIVFGQTFQGEKYKSFGEQEHGIFGAALSFGYTAQGGDGQRDPAREGKDPHRHERRRCRHLQNPLSLSRPLR